MEKKWLTDKEHTWEEGKRARVKIAYWQRHNIEKFEMEVTKD